MDRFAKLVITYASSATACFNGRGCFACGARSCELYSQKVRWDEDYLDTYHIEAPKSQLISVFFGVYCQASTSVVLYEMPVERRKNITPT